MGQFTKRQDEESFYNKNYDKNYTGNVYRTYSFLNLLDLEYAKQ